MSKEIQPPEYFAGQYEGSRGHMLVLASRIRERDAQIAGALEEAMAIGASGSMGDAQRAWIAVTAIVAALRAGA